MSHVLGVILGMFIGFIIVVVMSFCAVHVLSKQKTIRRERPIADEYEYYCD